MSGSRANKYVHFESASCFTNKLSNISESNKTKCSTFDALAVGEHTFVPFTFVKKLVSFCHAAIDAENEANCELGDSVGVLSWAVCDVDSAFGGMSNINSVDSGTGSDDKLKFMASVDVYSFNFLGADDEDVWLELF